MKAFSTAVDMGDMGRNHLQLELRVTGQRRFAFRMWLAIWLIRLAGMVCPINVNLIEDFDKTTLD